MDWATLTRVRDCKVGRMAWTPSADELSTNWEAFRQLHAAGVLDVDIADRQVSRASAAGWIGFRHFFVSGKRVVLRRMLASPDDFHRAFEWGVDIILREGGVPVRPWELENIERKRPRHE